MELGVKRSFKVAKELLKTSSLIGNTYRKGEACISTLPIATTSSNISDTHWYSRINEFRSKVAIVDKDGDFLYEDVFRRSSDLAKCIKDLDCLSSKNIVFLCPHGISYVITQWACWIGGHTAIPLDKNVNSELIERIIGENKATLIISTNDLVHKVNDIAKRNDKIKLIVLDGTWRENPVKSFDLTKDLPLVHPPSLDTNGLILYTSGLTLGSPKGIPLTHKDIQSRVNCIIQGWELTSEDNVLHALPLNHNYGVINALNAPLNIGGKIVLLNNYDTVRIWSHLLGIGVDSGQAYPKINMFPSLPSIYVKLLERHGDLFHSKKMREYVKKSTVKKIRLMTSSGASMPYKLLRKWKAITGHEIVESYSSTEVGTALSGSITKPTLLNQTELKPQCGMPLVDVHTKIVRFLDDEKQNYDILGEFPNDKMLENPIIGELMIKSPSIASTPDISLYEGGWYLTGDIVQVSIHGCHRIIGRLSVDSIEGKGKILNIQRKLMSHPDVRDCCVFGISDPLNGSERVGIVEDEYSHRKPRLVGVLVLDTNKNPKLNKVLEWYQDNLLFDEIPNIFKVLPEFPLDKSGRINKLEVAKLIFKDEERIPLLFINDRRL